jgi:hypothetical protein
MAMFPHEKRFCTVANACEITTKPVDTILLSRPRDTTTRCSACGTQILRRKKCNPTSPKCRPKQSQRRIRSQVACLPGYPELTSGEYRSLHCFSQKYRLILKSRHGSHLARWSRPESHLSHILRSDHHTHIPAQRGLPTPSRPHRALQASWHYVWVGKPSLSSRRDGV